LSAEYFAFAVVIAFAFLSVIPEGNLLLALPFTLHMSHFTLVPPNNFAQEENHRFYSQIQHPTI